MTHRRRISSALMVIGASLPLLGLGYLVWGTGLEPLADVWGSGYPREAWRTMVLSTVIGSALICVGVVIHPAEEKRTDES